MAQAAPVVAKAVPTWRTPWGWLAIVSLLISFAFVWFPLYIIRPFRTQHATELRWALGIEQFAPLVTTLAAVFALWSIVNLWLAAKGKRLAWLRRTGYAVAACLVIFFAVAARLDVYEFMFHPISQLHFVPAEQANLPADDMVMTASFNGVAHAYPIREMAYHHVANDVVGDVPVVATY
jgi:hypothetical protein